ncbi:acyltransferase family protein [Mucilaginibacter glaciei]|uniref:Acyltransferase n=1 Tax=Mucilaginibacter glaciei TaxID=2772109 RepID=A0A926NU97_9SPHI|nr:acyltransferase [Mucilaginibacter glaciei]MBD1394717.1 acyltransferase [Mucilaginibacter glaciei]
MPLKNINILRGIAALAVTWFHLTNNSSLGKSVAATGQYGYLGVEIFFVISGYILPYSMAMRSYRLADYGRFNAKRLLRIYPPYVITIILGIALMMVTKVPVPDSRILLSEFAYLNSILGYFWTVPVFWTLAIEVQFYIFISLFYPLITSRSNTVFVLSLLPMFALAFVIPSSFLPNWFGMFALGIVLFRKTELKLQPALFWSLTIAVAAFIMYVNGRYQSITALCTVLFILFIPAEKNNRLTSAGVWLGSVSYSLYLIHWDWGRVMIAVSRHLPLAGNYEWLRLTFGLGMSLFLAWLFYTFIEKPSINLSNKLKYGRKRSPVKT